MSNSANPWDCSPQSSLPMEFSQQEYWSGAPFPPLRDLPNTRIKPMSHLCLALAGWFFTTSTTWEAQHIHWCMDKFNQSFNSVQFSYSVMSDSLQHHGLQHARLPCPSPTPGVYSNSCPSSRWFHPNISSSVVPFSSRLQSFPASGSFPVSQLFASGGQSYWSFSFSIGPSASASVLSASASVLNIQDWFPLGFTGMISLQSKGISRVFSNITVQKHQSINLVYTLFKAVWIYEVVFTHFFQEDFLSLR